MAKIALMIGISEYGSGLNSLPSTIKNIEAMQQVLQQLERGGFDEVKCLSNPNPPMMREALETLFSNRHENDLILLFFSGHVVQDNHGKLYFATSVTCKTSRTELIRVSTIPASFVQGLINNSGYQRVVLILDCCLDNISLEEINLNNNNDLDIKTELGGEGRAILSCFTSSQKSWEQEEIDLDNSVYANYLIEGMKTGIADLDDDGWIAVKELHQYASNKLKIAAPALKPDFYSIETASEILLLLAPNNDLKLQYRKEVERLVNFGEISPAGNYILDKLSDSFSLTSEDCQVIKKAVFKPYQDYKKNRQRYKEEYEKAITNTYFLDNHEQSKLRDIQHFLGLKNEDIASIEEQVALNKDQISATQTEPDNYSQDSKDPSNSMPLTLDGVIDTEIEAISVSQDDVEQPIPDSNNPVVIETEIEAISVSQDDIEQPIPDSISIINSPLLPPSIVVPDIPITPSVNLVTGDSKNNYADVSRFPNQFIIPIVIGGIIATIGVVIAFSNRTKIAPLPAPIVRGTTTSEKPSPPTPSPSSSPESKVCTVFINGNLRSEPTYFRNNVVEALREPVAITGKQTKGGWIEVRMPDNKLAWAYQDIISEQGRKQMNDCLTKKKTTITLIEDILPPQAIPSP